MSTGNGAPAGPLDSMFAKTNVVVLVLFGVCCGQIAFILSLICLVTAKDPLAKKNAIITLIASVILNVVLVILYVIMGAGAAMMQPGRP
jgi:hypothetical protein